MGIRKRFFQQFPPSSDFADMPNYGAASFNGELKSLMVEYGSTSGGQSDAIGNAQQGSQETDVVEKRQAHGSSGHCFLLDHPGHCCFGQELGQRLLLSLLMMGGAHAIH